VSTNLDEEIEKDFAGERSPAWLSGFLLLGILIGLLGSLLIAWQYHIDVEPQIIGLHFLALSAGYVIAATVAQRWVRDISLRTVAMISCGMAVASLLALSQVPPPLSVAWRIAAVGFMGMAAGGLSTALLYSSEPYFAESPVAATNIAGSLLGCGCLIATIMTGATYFAGSLQVEMSILAAFPAVYFVIFWRSSYPLARSTVGEREEDAVREMLKDLRSIATVLFSLLLFFQFGNEWAIAGWLPLFLIHRLGINPVWAIGCLAFYFFALMIGRVVAQLLLGWLNHRRMLLGSIGLALLGYLVLSLTTSLPGAVIAVLLIGAGYAPIYPLIAERLDDRFSYHPGFWNGTISIAITGAMCGPWLLGYVDDFLGMQFVMLLPAFGSLVVFLLAVLLMFEARLMGEKKRDREPELLITADDV
jgi:fucose permease